MLTDQRISTFYEDVQSLGLKRPVAAIAKETGYSKGNVSLYLSKKLPPSGKFIDRFYEVFKKSFKKGIEKSDEMRGTSETQIVVSELSPSDLIKAIQTLADSNQGLVESNKIALNNNKTALETNQVIADTNRVLAMKLVNEDTNSIGAQLSDIDRASILVPLAEVMAGIASGELKYSTKAEAIAELGMKLNLHKPGKGSRERSEVGAGKKGIV